MAEIKDFGFLRQLRSDASVHIQRYRAGKQANPQHEMTTDQWLAGGS